MHDARDLARVSFFSIFVSKGKCEMRALLLVAESHMEHDMEMESHKKNLLVLSARYC